MNDEVRKYLLERKNEAERRAHANELLSVFKSMAQADTTGTAAMIRKEMLENIAERGAFEKVPAKSADAEQWLERMTKQFPGWKYGSLSEMEKARRETAKPKAKPEPLPPGFKEWPPSARLAYANGDKSFRSAPRPRNVSFKEAVGKLERANAKKHGK